MDKVLFWDFHGTLVYPDTLWSINVYRALRDNIKDSRITLEDIRMNFDSDGFPWQRPELDYTDIKTPEKWWGYLEKAFYNTYIACGLSERDAKDISPLVREKVLMLRNYRLFPETKETLESLQQNGFNNVVLSNNFPELDFIIDGLGLSDNVLEVISSANVGYEKPRTEIFEYALKKFMYPKTCFVIGDNEKSDIKGGKNAGIKTILLSKSKKSCADFICNNLSEIRDVLLRYY